MSRKKTVDILSQSPEGNTDQEIAENKLKIANKKKEYLIKFIIYLATFLYGYVNSAPTYDSIVYSAGFYSIIYLTEEKNERYNYVSRKFDLTVRVLNKVLQIWNVAFITLWCINIFIPLGDIFTKIAIFNASFNTFKCLFYFMAFFVKECFMDLKEN